MCDMIKEVGYRINVIPETELLIVTNSKLSEEEIELLKQLKEKENFK